MNIQSENKDLKLYNKEGVRVYSYRTYSDGFWSEYTYDEKGNELTFKDSDGFWYEYTYDEEGNKLTYKNSKGSWSERTYDEEGYLLTFKNSI